MVHWNFLLFIYLLIYLLQSAGQVFLSRLNISYLRQYGSTVPAGFEDRVNQETLSKISAYTLDSSRFGLFSTLIQEGAFLIILLSGLFPFLDWILQTAHWSNVWSGLAFFAILGIMSNVFQLPFDLYGTFVIEQRHGFNTKTWKVWTADLVKGLILSALLGGLLLSLLLALIIHGGAFWWLWAWMSVGLFELLVMWLYPVIIAPLFNRFEPLDDPDLVQRIEALMAQVGLQAKGVFRMDASKRSKHTNAYFTGIGKSKRIVLFDTLLTSHGKEEILAVLTHEIGHWKKRHVLKQLVQIEILSLIGFYVTAQLLGWPYLYRTFGFPGPTPYVGLLLVGILFGPLGYFLQPLESAISRRYEREADDFSLRLMATGEPLAQALKRLATDNLANLTPHPLYAWFYYSHPPLVERISRLLKFAQS